jgi:Protein of unknown function (DUF1761)
MPDFQISFLAILLAVIANFIFGFVWYTVLFKRIWAIEMGFNPDESPNKSEMIKGISLMIFGNFLLAWVLSHNIAAWNPETWGLAPSDTSSLARAGMAAFFAWLGFFVPMLFSSVAWEKKSWRLFGINASYHLLALVLVSVIVTHA